MKRDEHRHSGDFCPWCEAPRAGAPSAFFQCGSWDQLNPQDGGPRFRSEDCKELEGGPL